MSDDIEIEHDRYRYTGDYPDHFTAESVNGRWWHSMQDAVVGVAIATATELTGSTRIRLHIDPTTATPSMDQMWEYSLDEFVDEIGQTWVPAEPVEAHLHRALDYTGVVPPNSIDAEHKHLRVVDEGGSLRICGEGDPAPEGIVAIADRDGAAGLVAYEGASIEVDSIVREARQDILEGAAAALADE